MINKVILIGRLGRDPELRYTQGGTAVCDFSLATDEVFKDERRTEWHRIVTWSRLAEISGEYLKKGKLVYIEGRLQTREWDDRDGNKRRTTEIVAREMKMLSGPGETQGESKSMGRPSGETSSSMEVGITDDDIPF